MLDCVFPKVGPPSRRLVGRIHYKKPQLVSSFPLLPQFFPQNNRCALDLCTTFYLKPHFCWRV